MKYLKFMTVLGIVFMNRKGGSRNFEEEGPNFRALDTCSHPTSSKPKLTMIMPLTAATIYLVYIYNKIFNQNFGIKRSA